jgi:hypothetical protein
LEKCLKVLEADENIPLSYPDVTAIDENGKIISVLRNEMYLEDDSPHARLRMFEKKVSLCNQLLGLIRYKNLHQTRLIGSYIGSDVVLTIELLLQGKCIRIPDNLLFRREHHNNCRKLPPKERARWFNTSYNGFIHRFPLTYLFVQKLLAVKYSKLELHKKIVCYPLIGWWVLRKWHDLGGAYKAKIMSRLF